MSSKKNIQNAMDIAGDGLGEIMKSLRQRADLAKKEGKTSEYRAANALYHEAVVIALTRLRIKIKEIDESTKVKDLITSMKGISKSLKSEAKKIKNLTTKLNDAKKFIAKAEKLFNQVIKLAT